MPSSSIRTAPATIPNNGGVIDKGFFDYALIAVQDQGIDDGFYFVGVPGQEAFQLPSLISGAQSIWHDTTGVRLDRQADLRSYPW